MLVSSFGSFFSYVIDARSHEPEEIMEFKKNSHGIFR